MGIVNKICSIRQFRTAYDVPPSIPKPIAQLISHVTPASVRNLGGTYSCSSVYVHPCNPYNFGDYKLVRKKNCIRYCIVIACTKNPCNVRNVTNSSK